MPVGPRDDGRLPRALRWRARANVGSWCALALLATATILASSPVSAETVQVDFDVLANTTLSNACIDAPATSFGQVVPTASAGGAITSTGSGVCRVSFSSTSPAQLRIGQADGAGTAMGAGITAPAVLTQAAAAGRVQGVFGADASLAYAIGLSGTVYRTSNGGVSPWSEAATSACGGSISGRDVEMIPGDPNTWWAVGDNAWLCRTTNGQTSPFTSVTWSNQTAALTAAGWPAASDVNELTLPSSSTMYIGGEGHWLGKMNVGAGTWTAFQHSDSTLGDIVSIDAVASTSNVMALADNAKVLYTTTGTMTSANWAVTTLPGSPTTTTDVAIASTSRAYAVGSDGYLAVWNGTSWTDQSAAIATSKDLCGVDSLPGSPNSVIVLDCTGLVYKSTDAGATWTNTPTGTASLSTDIHATTASDAYASSFSRVKNASHDGGVTWYSQDPVSSEELTSIAASPIDGKNLLTISANAYRSTDRGANWTSAPALSGKALRGVALVGDAGGWAVGDAASIVYTSDLGATWTSQSPPAGVTATLTDVVALGSDSAIAVGMDGTIVGTANRGSAWTTRPSGTTRHLMGVARIGDVLVAVGARGTVLRSTDKGTTWTAITGGALPSATQNLLDVAAANATTFYALGRSVVWKSVDQGATWTVAANVPTIRARAIAAKSHTVVLVGDNERVEYSTDDAATFTGVTGATARTLHGVTLTDSHTAFIVGGNSIRIRMDVDPGALVQVPDWTASTNDWDSGGFFGVCLQAIGGIAVADWTPDTMNTSGKCEKLDSDPWQALPATATIAAHTSAAGTANVDLVWGFRPAPNQQKGMYEAGVAFEALAP